MPRLDQTGPQGQGPMTGRGAGICAKQQGWCRRGGFGQGYGQGFGFGRNYLSKSEELDELKENQEYLESDLKAIKERITELSAK